MARSSPSKQNSKSKGDEAGPQDEESVENVEDVKETKKDGSLGVEQDSNEDGGDDDEGNPSGPPNLGAPPPQVPIQPYFAPYPYPPYGGMPGYPPMMPPPFNSTDFTAGYTDASTMADPTPDTRRNRGGVTEPFPERLHRMLEATEREGLHDVVSFFSHGRAFSIHKPRRFTTEIMPRFFRQTKLTSFQRQLNLYGFRRISQGPDNGGYYHELFLKGRPGLCVNMKRTKIKGAAKFKRDPDSEPNFYVLRPIATPVVPGAAPGPPTALGTNPYPYPPPPYGYAASPPGPYTAAQGAPSNVGGPVPYPYPPPPYWAYWGAPPPGPPQAAPTPGKSDVEPEIPGEEDKSEGGEAV